MRVLKITLRVLIQLLRAQWGNDMFVGLERQVQFFEGIVQDMGKNLGIALVADITGKPAPSQPVFDRYECGIFSIGHCRDTLNKKRVTCVKIDSIIGILSSLGHAYT